jgi:hypothetical protein
MTFLEKEGPAPGIQKAIQELADAIILYVEDQVGTTDNIPSIMANVNGLTLQAVSKLCSAIANGQRKYYDDILSEKRWDGKIN